MSITIEGKLAVQQIPGRRGLFAVGELTTEIGSFKVKESILDQFEAGEYSGRFVVDRIYPDPYIFRGRVITDIRAVVSDIFLDDFEEKNTDSISCEPDPADQNIGLSNTSDKHDATPTEPVSALKQSEVLPTEPLQDPLLTLFGQEIYEQIQKGLPVKLDATVERVKLREQAGTMRNKLGYTFDAKSQTWFKQ